MAVKKILFVTLTNIGDVILTLPSLDYLRVRFPQAAITVISGPRAGGLFEENPAIARYIMFDKHAPLSQKTRFFLDLSKENFDLVIDLRNSLLGIALGRQRRIFFPAKAGPGAAASHLAKVAAITGGDQGLPRTAGSIYINDDARAHIRSLLAQNRLAGKKMTVISPGARSEIKRWSKDKFCEVAKGICADPDCAVVLVGDAADREITGYISRNAPESIDFAGKTTLPQLAYLLSLCRMLITNDSANLHLAGYLDVPTVAVFGPTDDKRYGPWSSHSRVVKAALPCRPCKKPLCRESTLECLHSIEAGEVLAAVRELTAQVDNFTPG